MFASGFTFTLGALGRMVIVLTKPRRMPLFSALSGRIDAMASRAKTWWVVGLLFGFPMAYPIYDVIRDALGSQS